MVIANGGFQKFEEGITLALTKKHTIEISSFVEKAKTLGVLGVKVTQHNELKAEWLCEVNAAEIFIRRQKVLRLVRWDLPYRKD